MRNTRKLLGLVNTVVILLMVLGFLVSLEQEPEGVIPYVIGEEMCPVRAEPTREPLGDGHVCLYHHRGYSYLEVYDRNSAFLYSIKFKDFSSGIPRVRCEGDTVYVQLRNNDVYAFRDGAEVAHWDREEATAQGHGYEWFRETEEPPQQAPVWLLVGFLILGLIFGVLIYALLRRSLGTKDRRLPDR